MSLDAIAPPMDLAAIAYFFLAIGIYRLIGGRRTLVARSLAGAIQQQRLQWMLNMARRENRMLDAIQLGSLGQGNAFFASTSGRRAGRHHGLGREGAGDPPAPPLRGPSPPLPLHHS